MSPTFDKWSKTEVKIEEDLSLASKIRGQGHAHYEFEKNTEITIEVTSISSTVLVAWQNGETRFELFEYKRLKPGVRLSGTLVPIKF